MGFPSEHRWSLGILRIANERTNCGVKVTNDFKCWRTPLQSWSGFPGLMAFVRFSIDSGWNLPAGPWSRSSGVAGLTGYTLRILNHVWITTFLLFRPDDLSQWNIV